MSRSSTLLGKLSRGGSFDSWLFCGYKVFFFFSLFGWWYTISPPLTDSPDTKDTNEGMFQDQDVERHALKNSYVEVDEEGTQNLAKELNSRLKLLKEPLPPCNPDGGNPSSTELEGQLWSQKNNGVWKKKWFVWRFSQLHQQWVLYAYKSRDSSVPSSILTPVNFIFLTLAMLQVSLKDLVPSKIRAVIKTGNDDPNATNMHKITFVHLEEFSVKQQELNLEQMARRNVPASKHQLRIFTKKALYILG